MRRRRIWLLVIGLNFVFFTGQSSAEVSSLNFADLLEQMTNLDWLYLAPAPGERQFQFSSYDRKSRVDQGIKLDWFANADAGNYLREEKVPGGTEYVMADFQGPGYIARIWSANPGKDRWRIYLDNSDKPIVDEPGADLLSGKGRYFKEPFAGKRAMGQVLLFPIPFSKACKVSLFTTAKSKPIRYYQIDIISLPNVKAIETFKIQDLELYQDKIQKQGEILKSKTPLIPDGLEEIKFELELELGTDKKMVELQGPAVVKMIELNVPQRSWQNLRFILNKILFKGQFDELAQPCILAPVSAFFGSSPASQTYHSIVSSIDWNKKDKIVSLKSFWPMPFQKKAHFFLTNYSKEPLKISGRILLDKKSVPGDVLYFHGNYSYLDNYPTRPFSDWTLLEAEDGAGRYVGTMLSIRNPDYIWWGEGDEKVFVDGEKFPSIFGTGTEDYFSYAWGTDYQGFSHPYYGIPVPADKGRQLFLAPFQALPYRLIIVSEPKQEIVSQYRWHILDQIPFHQSIKFDLEIWHWTPDITFDLQAMSYWYGQASVSSRVQLFKPEEIPAW